VVQHRRHSFFKGGRGGKEKGGNRRVIVRYLPPPSFKSVGKRALDFQIVTRCRGGGGEKKVVIFFVKITRRSGKKGEGLDQSEWRPSLPRLTVGREKGEGNGRKKERKDDERFTRKLIHDLRTENLKKRGGGKERLLTVSPGKAGEGKEGGREGEKKVDQG